MLVVVSGLPGSGKTTLARPLSVTLGVPLLDKDDLLETLLDSLGAESPEARGRLSRAADAVLQQVSQAASGAVLSSFWRRESLSVTSGTPTEWLRSLPDVVEVYCDCPPRVAAERFHARARHAGHFDQNTSFADSVRRYERLANTLPLDLGPVVRVDTTRDVDVPAVAAAVRAAVERVVTGVTVEAMEIIDLPPERFTDALRLWVDAGLTRPWNDAEQDLLRAVGGSASTVLAAVAEGVLAGTVMVGHDGHRGWVYYLAVVEGRRGSGVGRALMQAAERWVVERGIPKLQLLVRAENEGAIGFYTRLGYEQGDVVMLGRRLSR